ncbi:MAG: 3-phosphoshikimate 1-carboxyvinyltransferase [Candidatus Cloacimonadota bacterium]|nr:MAG: 3-phosphoshikimate 1-carboxyvinyltransferase [Candidatus Cloacimonadota bacterium]
MESEINLGNFIEVEGSKSIINRILIIASILNKPLRIYNYSSCEDIKTMQANVTKMGIDFKMGDNFVDLISSQLPQNNLKLHVQDSATAFRLLLARMAALPGVNSTITISSQLQNRPHKHLVDVLNKIGADVKQIDDRFEISGCKLSGGVLDINASISSQFISALLLISPLMLDDLIVNLKGTRASNGYIEMTISIMKQFGIEVKTNNNQISVAAGQKYKAIDSYYIEPDFSSLCYFWALGALSKKGVNTNYISISMQPDHKFINLLRLMGADIQIDNSRISVKKNKLSGISVNMSNMPDQVPTLAVLAIFADSSTTINNIAHLKHKESDRLKAIKDEFTKLGVKVVLTRNSLQINPCRNINKNVTLKTYNDHRLVMAFSILKKNIPTISLQSVVAVKKSNPLYFKQLNLIS